MKQPMIHLLLGTARQPMRYRTRCGASVTRDHGCYVYNEAQLRERVTCPRCLVEQPSFAACSRRQS